MESIDYSKLQFCLYVRRSQDREDRQVQSIASQVREIKSLAKRQGIKISKVYEDSASAYKPYNRPGFRQMMDDIKAGKISGILTWKADRLARNMIDTGEITHSLQTREFDVILTPYNRYLYSDNILPLIIEMGMANQYSRDISRNVKIGNETRIKKGWLCGQAPFGYKNCLQTKTIIKDDVVFDKLKNLLELFSTGKYSVAQLSEISTKSHNLLNPKTGKPMSLTGLYNVLKNPFYYGKIKRGSLDEWGKHPQMISKELFDKNQEVLSQSGRSVETNCEFTYTGLIECGACQRSITAEEKIKYKCPKCAKKHTAKKPKQCKCGHQIQFKDLRNAKRYTYYHCSRGKQKCEQKFVNATKLDNQITAFIEKLVVDKNFVDWANLWLDSLEAELDITENKKLEEQKRRSYELDEKLSGLIDLRIADELDEKSFSLKKAQIDDEIKELDQEKGSNGIICKVHEEIEFLIGLKNQYAQADKKEKKHVLKRLSSNPILIDEKLDVQAKKPYLYIVALRKHQTLGIEPLINQSDKGFMVLQKECKTLWQALLNEFETN